MQPPARVAEPLDEQPLDEAVHVFVGAADERRIGSAALEDVLQRGVNLPGFVARQHAGVCQRTRPRPTAGDVVFEETAIEPKRRAEFEGGGVRRGVEPPGPQIRHVMATSFGVGGVPLASRMSQRPLNSFSRTTPVTRSLALVTKASSASRAGVNQRPRCTRSAYSRLTMSHNRLRSSEATHVRRARCAAWSTMAAGASRRSRAVWRPRPWTAAMVPRLSNRSRTGIATPLTPVGTPRSNARWT